MSSSTSNSEYAVSAENGPAERFIYLKILLAIMLGMGLSLGIVRVFTHLNDASAETFLGRVLEAQAALPRIVSEDDELMMFFGSSMVEAGFSARQFDRELAEQGVAIKSFNFGFGGLNPMFQDYLSRRIADEFEREQRTLKLTLIEFNPFQTTVARRNGAREIEDSFVALLASPRELLEITRDDPTTGILMGTIRYLRDGVSAEMITSFFGRAFQAQRPRTQLPEDPAIVERRDELGEQLSQKFAEEYPDFDGAEWSYQWQGAGTIPEERSAETREIFTQFYKTLRTDHELDDDRLSRIHSADIIDLNFDETLVAAFIQVVRNFQRISEHVEVVLLPKNTDWIKNPPDAIARQQQVLERIAAETGVSIRNFQTIDAVNPEMFSDTTHLARYSGDVAFTDFLVEQYRPLLRKQR